MRRVFLGIIAVGPKDSRGSLFGIKVTVVARRRRFALPKLVVEQVQDLIRAELAVHDSRKLWFVENRILVYSRGCIRAMSVYLRMATLLFVLGWPQQSTATLMESRKSSLQQTLGVAEDVEHIVRGIFGLVAELFTKTTVSEYPQSSWLV